MRRQSGINITNIARLAFAEQQAMTIERFLIAAGATTAAAHQRQSLVLIARALARARKAFQDAAQALRTKKPPRARRRPVSPQTQTRRITR